MELLQLRYFYESAKNENFSKTAKAYMVPTSSVSASIKRLENELGCELFDRTANRIQLNANGQLLCRTLNSVFNDIDRVVEEISEHIEDTRQINILVRGMREKVAELITEYSTKHPNVVFKTMFDYDDCNIDEYDVIIDAEKEMYAGYDKTELFDMRLRLKCSADSALCQKKIYLNQLKNCSFVSMGANSNMHRILTDACMAAGFIPKFSVVCNDIACCKKFIAAGMGIGIARQNNHPSGSEGICDLDVADFDEHYTVAKT